jgi:hypothetical protein
VTAALSVPAGIDPASSVAVVGGGMLGLTVALRLAERGERVTLFERAPTFGGLADVWEIGDVIWDRHYHVTLYSDTTLRELLVDLGLEEQMRWNTVGTGFYTGGKFYPMNNALDFLRFPPLGLIDKLRLGATIFGGSRIKDPAPLDNVSVERWLTARAARRSKRFGVRCCSQNSGNATATRRPPSSGRSSCGCTPRAGPDSARSASATFPAATRRCSRPSKPAYARSALRSFPTPT